MPLSAHDVAAVLRDRLPGLPTKKLHKLLYYCQGHHLATFDKPLFSDPISAWDMGPVVGALWRAERQGTAPAARTDLDEAQLNTIGYVLSRYGALTGRDLEHLTHSEDPWRRADRARQPGGDAPIELDWITQYFRTDDSTESGEGVLDSAAVTKWLQNAEDPGDKPGREDKPEELGAMIQEIKARLAQRA